MKNSNRRHTIDQGEPKQVRGRYAPSPTGLTHLGNARTALIAWLSVRSKGGKAIWRLEDLDGPRVVKGMAEAAAEDLAWLGLDWDEGLNDNGPFIPYAQSVRSALYEDALDHLFRQQRLFPCRLSRKDLRSLASAPHGETAGLSPYPRHLRPKRLPANWYTRHKCGEINGAAIRFLVNDRPVSFVDRVFGRQEEQVDRHVGDFVLKRKDGLYAYQLAVVVDDIHMEITEVVRGADLLSSTARQIQLFEALGARAPDFAHVPLVLNAEGRKISKRNGGLTLRELRSSGVKAEQIVGYLAWSIGLMPAAKACRPHELVSLFDWKNISRSDWILPNGIEMEIGSIT